MNLFYTQACICPFTISICPFTISLQGTFETGKMSDICCFQPEKQAEADAQMLSTEQKANQ